MIDHNAMRRSLAIACLLVAGQLDVFAVSAQQPTIRGQVLDDMSGFPVNFAAVHLLSLDGKSVATVFADSLGKFVLAAPAPGRYRVRAERIGYATVQSRELVLTTTSPPPLEFRLNPTAWVLDEIFVESKSEGRRLRRTEQLIHGRLIDDQSKQPVSSASVSLMQGTDKIVTRTFTNDQGLFRLVTPIPGSYRLKAEQVGYVSSEGPPIRTVLGDTIRVDFFISANVIPLAPLVVRASARPWASRGNMTGMEALFSRMANWSAFSEFITLDELKEYDRRYYTLSEIIRSKALRSPRGCSGGTRYFLNGVEYVRPTGFPIDEIWLPRHLEAMEIHTAPAIPTELGIGPGFLCRAIVLWTRRSR